LKIKIINYEALQLRCHASLLFKELNIDVNVTAQCFLKVLEITKHDYTFIFIHQAWWEKEDMKLMNRTYLIQVVDKR
jgi:hypothetical protein